MNFQSFDVFVQFKELSVSVRGPGEIEKTDPAASL